jgi:AcrR family transcriptional regulator
LRLGQEPRVDGPHPDPGVVDEEIEPAELAVDGVDRGGNRAGVADIEPDPQRARAQRGDKRALLTAMVRERYGGMAGLARAAEVIEDPGEAFETLLRTYLEAAEGDAGFQLALLGSRDLEWEDIERQKAEFAAIVARIINRAVDAGAVRGDLTSPISPCSPAARCRRCTSSPAATATGGAGSSWCSKACAARLRRAEGVVDGAAKEVVHRGTGVGMVDGDDLDRAEVGTAAVDDETPVGQVLGDRQRRQHRSAGTLASEAT